MSSCPIHAAATPASDHFCDYATGVRILAADHKNDAGSRERERRGRSREGRQTEQRRGRHVEKERRGETETKRGRVNRQRWEGGGGNS